MVLPSTKVTLFLQYYDHSDFLQHVSRFLSVKLVSQYFFEDLVGSPTFMQILSQHAVLYDPENVLYFYLVLRNIRCCFLLSEAHQPFHCQLLRGSITSTYVYGLQCPCLHLTQFVTSLSSRLGIRCVR